MARCSFSQYVQRADAISIVQVGKITPVFFDGELGFSQIEVRVLSSLKGNPAENIVVTVVGAESEGRRTIAPQAPRFSGGETVLLFLQHDPATDRWGIMGLRSGTYPIRIDSSGRVRIAGLYADENQDLESFQRRVVEAM